MQEFWKRAGVLPVWILDTNKVLSPIFELLSHVHIVITLVAKFFCIGEGTAVSAFPYTAN